MIGKKILTFKAILVVGIFARVAAKEKQHVQEEELSVDDKVWSDIRKRSAVFAMTGRRGSMEDRFFIAENINSTKISLFAVFDGHGGTQAADFAINTIIPNLINKITAAAQIREQTKRDQNLQSIDTIALEVSAECLKIKKPTAAISNSTESNKNLVSDEVQPPPPDYDAKCYVKNSKEIDYSSMISDEILFSDHALVKSMRRQDIYAGSTALIAILDGSKLTVTNVGDSRGVMCDHQGNTIALSIDHKPDRKDEEERIKKAGGFVSHWGVWRVNGILATSRALGDFFLKPKTVIADPEVLVFDLDEHKPQFFILASDGLWDTFTNEEAVEFIKKHINEPDYGARSISKQSYKLESYDNIATIVVNFKNN